MATKQGQPNFVQAWIKDLSDEVNDAWYRIIPVWVLLFFGSATAAAYYMPSSFWVNRAGEVVDHATILYTAILTLNGIIVALSWSAFGKIYEMIGAGKFSAFLQKHEVLESYLFLVRYVNVAQMSALVVSMATLIAAQFPQVPLTAQRVLCALALGFGAYAIKQASTAVGVTEDLVRYRAKFDAEDGRSDDGRGGLRAV